MKDASIKLNAPIKYLQTDIACSTAKEFLFDGITDWCPVRVLASSL